LPELKPAFCVYSTLAESFFAQGFVGSRAAQNSTPSLRAPAKQSIAPRKERMDCFGAPISVTVHLTRPGGRFRLREGPAASDSVAKRDAATTKVRMKTIFAQRRALVTDATSPSPISGTTLAQERFRLDEREFKKSGLGYVAMLSHIVFPGLKR
jgi:hypothetical protein